jgi:hypothetical protein
MILVVSGVVIGMAVAWIQELSRWLQISMLVLALVLLAVGLFLNLKFRSKQPQ